MEKVLLEYHIELEGVFMYIKEPIELPDGYSAKLERNKIGIHLDGNYICFEEKMQDGRRCENSRIWPLSKIKGLEASVVVFDEKHPIVLKPEKGRKYTFIVNQSSSA